MNSEALELTMTLYRQLGQLLDFVRADHGSTAIEYALIASLIFVAIVGALGLFTDSLGNLFATIGAAIT